MEKFAFMIHPIELSDISEIKIYGKMPDCIVESIIKNSTT